MCCKSGHSTDICTHTIKSAFNHYGRRGCHVSVCFIDHTKTSDSVNNWKLFLKLIDYYITYLIVLCHYLLFVTLINLIIRMHGVNNGTRQGSLQYLCSTCTLLTCYDTLLFLVWAAILVAEWSTFFLRCWWSWNVGPTWAGLQSLLHI